MSGEVIVAITLSILVIPPLAAAAYYIFFSERVVLDVDEEMRRLGVSESAAVNKPLIDSDPEHFERVKKAVRLKVSGGVAGFSFRHWLLEHGIFNAAEQTTIIYSFVVAAAAGASIGLVTTGLSLGFIWIVPGFLWGAAIGITVRYSALTLYFRMQMAKIRQGIPYLVEELIIALERTRDVWDALSKIAEVYKARNNQNPIAMLLIKAYEEARQSGKLEAALKKHAKDAALPAFGHLVAALNRLQSHGTSYEVELRRIADEALARTEREPWYLLHTPFSLEERLRFSGTGLNVTQFTALRWTITISLGLVAQLAGGMILTAAIIGLLGYVALSLVLDKLVQKRAATLRKELPLLLTYLQQQSRSGLEVFTALIEARKVLEPRGALAEELQLFEERIRSGVTEQQALYRFGDTYGLPELDYIVHALLIHRHTGGGLSQVLQKIQRSSFQRVLGDE